MMTLASDPVTAVPRANATPKYILIIKNSVDKEFTKLMR